MPFSNMDRLIVVNGSFVDWLGNGIGPGFPIMVQITYKSSDGDIESDAGRVLTDQNGGYVAGFNVPANATVTGIHAAADGAAYQDVVQDSEGNGSGIWTLQPLDPFHSNAVFLGNDSIQFLVADGANCGGSYVGELSANLTFTFNLIENDTVTFTWLANVQMAFSGYDSIAFYADGAETPFLTGSSTSSTGQCGMEMVGGSASIVLTAGIHQVLVIPDTGFYNGTDTNALYNVGCYWNIGLSSVIGFGATTYGGKSDGGSGNSFSLDPIVWADPDPVTNGAFPYYFFASPRPEPINAIPGGTNPYPGSFTILQLLPWQLDGEPGLLGLWQFTGFVKSGVIPTLSKLFTPIVLVLELAYFKPKNYPTTNPNLPLYVLKKHTFAFTITNTDNSWTYRAKVGASPFQRNLFDAYIVPAVQGTAAVGGDLPAVDDEDFEGYPPSAKRILTLNTLFMPPPPPPS